MLGDQDIFSLIFDEFAFTHPRNLVEEVLESMTTASRAQLVTVLPISVAEDDEEDAYESDYDTPSPFYQAKWSWHRRGYVPIPRFVEHRRPPRPATVHVTIIETFATGDGTDGAAFQLLEAESGSEDEGHGHATRHVRRRLNDLSEA